ncbi:hypothetical protein KAFR_0D02070 [Kazachstania africana CBS 2517]|uniref:Chromatin modification-related protein n=1 Tax=Kazachstania africana (strain ATCC 22294 / BCRC 22015 / CBS 2517 / CECT 1963 / NBRC 1671 / NRRL Y-8276) TaxID=1071382 RepID=H2AU04_KAZAF|nr:hypothetical protein KAFR_0D02070 [Kazachstania africana CBS 2517]CCF57854.1 hypothetical protein KAFR_0D02070 [Kazachstania africana CBS 2517]
MTSPANLYPGLYDTADVLEEVPLEVSKYLTLLHEIDAKCVNSMPELHQKIDKFLTVPIDKRVSDELVEKKKADKVKDLTYINGLFEELMQSLEEKMHVSSIMVESLQHLEERLEIAYEVAIRNQEIPVKLRLGADNHPAMHLHYELMEKIESKPGHRSSQAMKSESRREAMAANRKQNNDTKYTINSEQNTPSIDYESNSKKRSNVVGGSTDPKRRKRRTNNNNIMDNSSNAPNILTGISGSSSSSASSNKNSTGNPKANKTSDTIVNNKGERVNEYGEPLYCYCNQIAYGEMVGCDGESCELEWFHLPCIGLTTLPKGKWYCDECKKKM